MKPSIMNLFKTKKYIAALAIMLTYVVSAVAYSVVTPLWEAPDEVGHAGFMLHLRQTHTLPVQRIGDLGSAHHPPLYYLIAGIISAPADINDPTGAFRANPDFIWAGQGGSDVNAALHASAETFPYHGQALMMHLAAFGLCVDGSDHRGAGNRNRMAYLRGIPLDRAAGGRFDCFRAAVSLYQRGNQQRQSADDGGNRSLVADIASHEDARAAGRTGPMPAFGWPSLLLAKSSAAIPGVVVGLTLVVCALRNRSFGLFIRGAVALVLPVLLLTGWWFVRNQTLYGDPLGWSMFQEVYRVVMRSTPLAWNDVRQFFNTQIDSFAGVFGWMNVRATPVFYRIVRICGLLGLVGLVPFFARYRKELSRDQRAGLVFLAFTIVAQECYLLWAIQRFDASWYQGRYLFTVIGPIMIFLSLGIAGWLPKRRTALPVTVLILVLVGVAIYMPLRVIAPAYRTITLAKSALWLVPNKTELDVRISVQAAGLRDSASQGWLNADAQAVLAGRWQVGFRLLRLCPFD